MRLSRIVSPPEESHDPDSVPLRRIVLWSIVAIAIAVGLWLYFRYARFLVPLIG